MSEVKGKNILEEHERMSIQRPEVDRLLTPWGPPPARGSPSQWGMWVPH
jgi:hypothetical protein